MKKPVKILLAVLAVIVILIIVILAAIGMFADKAIKQGIQVAGTKTLGVNVDVNEVSLSILGGTMGMKGLVVDNPEGYNHKTLLQLGSGDVKIDTGSLLSDTITINDIKLDGMNVVLEQKGITGNNIKDIINNLPKKEEAEEEPKEPSGKKVQIDNLEITNTTVKVKLLPVPGKVDTVTLKLAPIKMTNLGGDNKLDVPGLISKIFVAITKGIAQQGAGVLPEDMLNSMSDALGKTLDIGKDVLKQGETLGKDALKGGQDVLESGKDIGKGLEDAGKGITDGVKGLFQKKEE